MTFDEEVLAALRNAAAVAVYIEDAGVETCANAAVIRALNLCAIGPVIETALAYAWDTGLPVDTPASQVLQSAHDRYACSVIEAIEAF